MSKILLFGDSNEDILSINLGDILCFINTAKELNWKIVWIEGVSVKGFDMLAFEAEVKKGLKVSYDELIDLNKKIVQIYDLVLVGDKENIEDKKEENCDYIIELIDSSFWEITSKNEEFIEKLRQNFHN
ncbi:hypothetical protein [Myroides sp. TSA_177.3]|uniref:hypothetical protein n=1 Tax=Myroides sp. TSA_177.3 TaxID=3415650 RepID=UPI00404665AC